MATSLKNPHEDEIDVSIVQDCGDLILASVGVQIIKVNHSCNKILLFSAFLASWTLVFVTHSTQLSDGGRKEQGEW